MLKKINWPKSLFIGEESSTKQINIKQRGISKMVKVKIIRSKGNVKSNSSNQYARNLSKLQGKRPSGFVSHRPDFSKQNDSKALQQVQRIGKTACKYLLRNMIGLAIYQTAKLAKWERKLK